MNWEIIDRVQRASRPNDSIALQTSNYPNFHKNSFNSMFVAEDIIRRRRSAQNYDRQASRTDMVAFNHALEKTLPHNSCPFDVFP